MQSTISARPGDWGAHDAPASYRSAESPITIALALLLAGAPAASVTAADWADFLTWLPIFATAGVLFALYLSRRRLSAPMAHTVGLATGIMFVLLYFATTADKGNFFERLAWLGTRIGAWIDVAVSGGASSDTLLFSLTMSLLAWFLGYSTGWFVFRERAPWWAILPNGAAVLINLSYAPPELLPFLVVFLLASLLLLVDMTRQRKRDREWAQAGPDAEESNRAVLVVSAGLCVMLLVFAWALPSGGISQRVSDTWYSLTQPWQGFQENFDRLFAALNAPERSGRGLNFGRTLAPRAAFELGEQPVLAIAIQGKEPRYWRAATYDRYTGQVFVSTEPNSSKTEADQPRIADTEEYQSRTDLEQRVQLLASQTSMLFAADTPKKVNLPTFYDYREVPDDFAAVRLATPLRRGQQYTVVSSVSVATVSELKGAGTDYPAWMQRYLRLPRSVPQRVRDEARRVTAGADTAYDKALALESYLRQFRYSTRVKQPPPDRDWVDYMLFDSKEGYCDYYAAAMAVMLRAVGVPARVASGFAPGDKDPSGEFIVVKESHAHSWTEAFFPNYGWINFEPSALRPVPQRLESFGLDLSQYGDIFGMYDDDDYGDIDFDALGALGAASGDSSGAADGELPGVVTVALDALAVLFGVVLLAGVAAVIFALNWQRSVRTLRDHVRPWAQLSAVTAWCGLGARPSDTPFEYATAVARRVPPVRHEVQAIADTYVRGTYGREAPDAASAARADDAWKGSRWMLARTLLRQNWRSLLGRRWPRGDR
ncbi:MAG TPA: transglutaminaseTgpA domain-containing protein [Chloroflexota bacterium]|jgi:transglutaminase-like putative cysteine protease